MPDIDPYKGSYFSTFILFFYKAGNAADINVLCRRHLSL